MPDTQAQNEAAAPVAAEVPKDQKNGVTRPKAGTQTARIWDISDSLSTALGKPVPRAEVLKAAVGEGLNSATAATQYGRWCKYYGVKADPAPKKEKVKKEKTQEAQAQAPAAPAQA